MKVDYWGVFFVVVLIMMVYKVEVRDSSNKESTWDLWVCVQAQSRYFFSNESPSTLSLSIQVYMKIETERSCFPVRFSPEFQTLYIAHSIKVALGIGKLLFGGHSSKALHCLICPITKATFFDLAVYHFLTGKVPLSDTLLSWTPNSKAQDSWFYRQKFPRFRNPACFTRLTENYCESN